MSAPLSPEHSLSATRNRPRGEPAILRPGAIAYRYGGIGTNLAGKTIALGVRHDDEDRDYGDATLLALMPGAARVLQRMPFAARRLGGALLADTTIAHTNQTSDASPSSQGSASLVLDSGHGLWLVGEGVLRQVRDDVIDLDGTIALTTAGDVLQLSPTPSAALMLATIPGARVLASTASGAILVGDNDGVSAFNALSAVAVPASPTRLLSGVGPVHGLAWSSTFGATAGGTLAVLLDDAVRLEPCDLAAPSLALLSSSSPSPTSPPVAGRSLSTTSVFRAAETQGPASARSITAFAGCFWLGDTGTGLWTVRAADDPANDGDDDAIALVRPSLRAHQLVVSGGRMLVASDLMVAEAEASLGGTVDLVSRDLSGFIRVAAPMPTPRPAR